MREPLGKFLYDREWVASVLDGASWAQSRKIIDEDGVPNWMSELGFHNLGRRSDYTMPVTISGPRHILLHFASQVSSILMMTSLLIMIR
jgi:hypothetical protein